MGSLLRGVLSCSTGPDRERCEVSDRVDDRVEPQRVEEVEVVLGSREFGVGDRLPETARSRSAKARASSASTKVSWEP